MGEDEKKVEEKKSDEKKPEEVKKSEEVKKPEEVKKTEEKKPVEEKKPDEKKSDEANTKEAPPPPPPPPQEIVLRVFMHCEGCAKKVRKCLKNFQGVEEVMTDCKSSKVVVKGEKADPLKVLERVQRKSHRRVELISPIPKPPSDDDKKKAEEESAKPKPEEKKEEPQVITVILRVHMHCEACAQEIKKRILRMKGVESAEPDLKSSQVTVKGIFDPPKLVEYVYKRTGKHAGIVKTEPEKKEGEKAENGEKGKDGKSDEKKGEGGDGKEEKKDGDGNKDEKKDGEGAKDGKKDGGDGSGGDEKKTEDGEDVTRVVEMRRNEFYYYPPKNFMEYYASPQMFSYENPNAYSPQMFSDENPNACSIV